LFISNFSVAFPLRVNSHIATICSVHARPANESLDAGHSQGPRGLLCLYPILAQHPSSREQSYCYNLFSSR